MHIIDNSVKLFNLQRAKAIGDRPEVFNAGKQTGCNALFTFARLENKKALVGLGKATFSSGEKEKVLHSTQGDHCHRILLR